MKWVKYTLVGLVALLLVLGIASYITLKSIGIIPRADYDTVAPVLPKFDRPAIMVLNKVNGFAHVDALPAADAMLQRIAAQRGWDIFITDNAATHNLADLRKFKAVVWSNVSGDVLTADQRLALKSWLAEGGGWVGIHGSGGDPSYQWPWYVDTLLGAQFVGHTQDPQFQDADILIVGGVSDVTKHLESPWRLPQEEWYAFDRNPRHKGYEILLAMDENSYITEGKTFWGQDRMEGEHPIAWRHQIGDGRAVYSAIGHQAATYSVSKYQQFIAEAVAWTMNDVK